MDSRRQADDCCIHERSSTIIGTGLIALDVVIADPICLAPVLYAGGTCGNVLTALSYLGWNAYPIARLRDDAASKRVTDDLASWGVRLDFVAMGDEGSTPVVVQHIRRDKAGQPTHSFSRKCPKCGVWLPWYKAVKAADVSNITNRFPPADVFYFDRTSRGAIELARHANESGWLVIFEPSTGSEPAQLEEALSVAHIVKIASDRLAGNEGILDSKAPILMVETQGSEGLRYRYRGNGGSGRWKRVDAFDRNSVIDTAGAGDWCTAGIISRLGPLGVEGLTNASAQMVETALTVGQAMAAWTCQFNGARGGMYESSKEDFVKAVESMLQGEASAVERNRSETLSKMTSDDPVWCDACLEGTGVKQRVHKKMSSR